jgi:hypothetical protein
MDLLDHYDLNIFIANLEYFELFEVFALGDKYGEIAVARPRQFGIDP